MARPMYACRDDVKIALDIKETARTNGQIDRALRASADLIDGGDRIGGLLRRRFYPETATRYFDWPQTFSRPFILWLGQHELASASLVVAGGTTIAATDYLLRPDHGPPYNRIEIDLSSTAAFAAGNTHQQAIAVTGVYAGCAADTEPAGTLAAALSSTSATTATVSDASLDTGICVGHIMIVDSERMLVTGAAMADTGQNSSTLTASAADVSITGVTAGTITVGETLLVDSERMLVVDVAGTTLTVKRAWDGTVLAAHTSGADLYAPRTVTVTRGALGSTAATHTISTALTRHVVPGPVRELSVAETVNLLLQRQSGYARTVGSGDNVRESSGRGLRSLRDQVWTSHGRKVRLGAV